MKNTVSGDKVWLITSTDSFKNILAKRKPWMLPHGVQWTLLKWHEIIPFALGNTQSSMHVTLKIQYHFMHLEAAICHIYILNTLPTHVKLIVHRTLLRRLLTQPSYHTFAMKIVRSLWPICSTLICIVTCQEESINDIIKVAPGKGVNITYEPITRSAVSSLITWAISCARNPCCVAAIFNETSQSMNTCSTYDIQLDNFIIDMEHSTYLFHRFEKGESATRVSLFDVLIGLVSVFWYHTHP